MRLLVLSIFLSLSLLTGCRKTPQEYSTHGISLILMDSKWDHRCGGLGIEVHDKMANWIINNEGAKSDPTYKGKSRSWKTGKGTNKDVAETDCSISSLEFIDANNNTNIIRTICIQDKGLLLIECTSLANYRSIDHWTALIQANAWSLHWMNPEAQALDTIVLSLI